MVSHITDRGIVLFQILFNRSIQYSSIFVVYIYIYIVLLLFSNIYIYYYTVLLFKQVIKAHMERCTYIGPSSTQYMYS